MAIPNLQEAQNTYSREQVSLVVSTSGSSATSALASNSTATSTALSVVRSTANSG